MGRVWGAGLVKARGCFGGGGGGGCWIGDGAESGSRGRGIVVVRCWGSGVEAVIGTVGDVVGSVGAAGMVLGGDVVVVGGVMGFDGAGATGFDAGDTAGFVGVGRGERVGSDVFVDAIGVTLEDRMTVPVGVAGSTCGDAAFGVVVARGCEGLFAPVADADFKVPVARTCSSILLVAGVPGVVCFEAIGAWGASLAGVAAFVRPDVFFSFFGSTIFSFVTAFTTGFFTTAFFTSTAGAGPASSATTFFGRPRFLVMGASTAAVVDSAILCAQLVRMLQQQNMAG